MSLLVAAVLLPTIFWNKGPETVDLLRKADIQEICVGPDEAAAWKQVSGIKVDVEAATVISLPTPSLTYRRHLASATSAPWVDSNGWRLLRNPNGEFFYNAPGAGATLAAAEAFAFQAHATIQTDEGGLQSLAKMLAFLRSVPEWHGMVPEVNIGYIDDGSPESGEFMNLLVRRNLLFEPEKAPNAGLAVNVALGQLDYPRSEVGNPLLLAEKVRGNLTDEKRLLRIYGSDVVIGRLYSNGKSARLVLVNYGAAGGGVNGLRVRVLGHYGTQAIAQFGEANTKLLDVSSSASATEFTLPELKTLAIINLAP